MSKAATAERPKVGQGGLFERVSPVPDELREDEALAQTSIMIPTERGLRRMSELVLSEPSTIQRFLTNLRNMRQWSIQLTRPQDWVLFGEAGSVKGWLCVGGAVEVRKLWGINIVNHRSAPDDSGVPGKVNVRSQPELGSDGKPTGRIITVAEIWADAFSTVSGASFPAVRGYKRVVGHGDKQWAGRGGEDDLMQSARTQCDTKAVQALSGLVGVPVDELLAAGIDVEKCRKGSGFGTSAERAAGGVAEAGVAEAAKALGEEILRRVGGDKDAARDLCREVTKGDKPGKDGKTFPGWDSVARLTQQWQLDAAWKKLKAHPTFGDAHQGREPGQDE